ncbi:hypothetical protein CY0110_19447 [Crocosphaera chwakensis CCY0110]|uniref:Uncharacterized protein n=1 Tax=Crocosphaera chwakensis CCY0110 TaxID=391612 RepID=A3IJM1_9CHRO|nr:hypothetical protein CY0110_19447 [Crocosphaera chwakensis CCY0110]
MFLPIPSLLSRHPHWTQQVQHLGVSYKLPLIIPKPVPLFGQYEWYFPGGQFFLLRSS